MNFLADDPRPTLELDFNRKRTYTALIDTGATRSYINQNIAAQLQTDGCETMDFANCVQVANGEIIILTEKIIIPVFIHNTMINHEFVIFPALAEEVVIGIDVFKEDRLKDSPAALQ